MIQIIDREVQIPTNEQVIGVQGDNLSQTRVFTIDKVVNGLDLSTFTPLIQLQAIYPTHPPYFDILRMEVLGEKLNLTWNIADHNMSSKGKLYFQIQLSKVVGSEAVIYQTIKNLFVVAPTIEARAEYENMTPIVFEQYITRAREEADRAESIANELTGRVDTAIDNANTQANYTKGVGDTLLQKLEDGEFKGDKGDGLNLAGSFPSLAELNKAFPKGNGVNSYLIGVDVYIWNGTAWLNSGRILGESAYEQAVSGGYKGSKEQFISDLNGIAPHIRDKAIHVTPADKTNWDGKAPSGFGLGENCKVITNWEDAKINGWYVGNNIIGAPTSSYEMGCVVSHGAYFVDIYIRDFGTSKKYIKQCFAGVWQPVREIFDKNITFSTTEPTSFVGEGNIVMVLE